MELWRMASKEQLGWERHLVRAEEWRERCRRSKDCEDGDDEERRVGGRSEVVGGDFDTADRGENREIVDDEVLTAMTNARLGKRRDSGNEVTEQAIQSESTDDEEGLEAMCGLTMRACRAKDLSTVLGELRMLGEAEA